LLERRGAVAEAEPERCRRDPWCQSRATEGERRLRPNTRTRCPSRPTLRVVVVHCRCVVLQSLLLLHRRRRSSTVDALLPEAPVLHRGRRHQLSLCQLLVPIAIVVPVLRLMVLQLMQDMATNVGGTLAAGVEQPEERGS
jgi:hypothetical protein